LPDGQKTQIPITQIPMKEKSSVNPSVPPSSNVPLPRIVQENNSKPVKKSSWPSRLTAILFVAIFGAVFLFCIRTVLKSCKFCK
jgi:hypothetical protein